MLRALPPPQKEQRVTATELFVFVCPLKHGAQHVSQQRRKSVCRRIQRDSTSHKLLHATANKLHACVCAFARSRSQRGGGDDTVRKCSVPAGRLNIQEERVATKREPWRPGGAGRNFLWCQNIATPLAAVWYHFTVLLPPLWSPRFPMCDWKCVCVFSTNLWMM